MLSVVAQALLLYISCVQVMIFLLPTMPTSAASGKSRPMRVGFRTGTRRLKVAEEGILL
jgi:hypothetical protein